MINFKQLIKPGDRGRDVKAVKNAMRRMHVNGSGALGRTKFAGKQFVICINHVQRNNKLRADGIYGNATHKVVAPHFTAYDRWLYRTAKLRKAQKNNVPPGDASVNAKKLLNYYYHGGKYRADNPGELPQIQLTAEGKPVWSQMGRYVYIDARVMKVLVWLIEEHGLTVGTFALCTDHFFDSPLGHSGGKCVDISSINNVGVNSSGQAARENTLKAADLLSHQTPPELRPAQLICDGYGYMHDGAISACTIPSASYYGWVTMSQHRNHIHVGYF